MFGDGVAWEAGLCDLGGKEGDGVTICECEGLWSARRGEPGTGAKPGCHVGDGAGRCSSLAETAEKEGKAVSVLGSGVDGDIGK
jgi:hypothetical protein